MKTFEVASEWVRKCAECVTSPYFIGLEEIVKRDLREAEIYLPNKNFAYAVGQVPCGFLRDAEIPMELHAGCILDASVQNRDRQGLYLKPLF